jgi:light-independent protochlorophyllide reductase subunit B
MIVGASCTAELIQDDPGGLAETMGLPVPVIPLELAQLPAQGELRRGRDLLPARPALAQPDGADRR